jgi:histidinol-phosphate aminotransferase
VKPPLDKPIPQPGIFEIAPYVPGRSKGLGVGQEIKLSANESPLGASPKAIAAYREIAEKLEIYPEGSSRELRRVLGEVNGIDPDRILVGAGSDEVLHLLAQTYIGVGDEAVMSQYGFSVYPIITQAAGGVPVVAPETDYRADIDAILGAVTEKTKMVFLVVDSAYAEYVTAEDYGVGISLVERSDNVVMVRTFSKMGLAAARVGWLYGPEHMIDALNRIRGPFNVSVPGQAAAAAAAADLAFTRALRDHNAKWREWLTAELSGNRLRVLPSQGNFILVLFPDTPGHTAADANKALLEAGLIVREMGGYGINNGLRISIGSEASMRAVAKCLKEFMDR